MKKKIERLLQEGQLAKNVEFKGLHQAYQAAQATVEQAKTAKKAAKNVYRSALEGPGKCSSDQSVESLADFRKAKYMQQYHRVEENLSKHRLYRWTEQWLQKSEVPHEPKPKSAKGKHRQSTSAPGAASVAEADKAAAPKRKKGVRDQK